MIYQILGDPYKVPITELAFSTQLHNCLRRAEALTLGQVFERSEDDLIAVRGLGLGLYDELLAKLAEYGWERRVVLLWCLDKQLLHSEEEVDQLTVDVEEVKLTMLYVDDLCNRSVFANDEYTPIRHGFLRFISRSEGRIKAYYALRAYEQASVKNKDIVLATLAELVKGSWPDTSIIHEWSGYDFNQPTKPMSPEQFATVHVLLDNLAALLSDTVPIGVS